MMMVMKRARHTDETGSRERGRGREQQTHKRERAMATQNRLSESQDRN